MLKKLRLKFVFINMAIVTCMLLVIFGLIVRYTDLELKQESEAALQTLAYGNYEPGRQNVKTPHFVIQFNPGGGATVSGNTYHDLEDEEFIQELIDRVYKEKKTTGFLEDYDLYYTIVSNKMAYRFVFVDASGQQAALNSLIRSCCIIGVIALAAFFLISMLLARWVVKPVEKAWDQQRQFVSDASHELKTPLTVIMSNAELLQNPEFDTEHKSQFASSILVMSQQMRHLVEDMLELARADNGHTKMEFTSFDLSDSVTDALLPFDPVFFEKGITLESKIHHGIFMRGSWDHLHQVLDILLDNAAKYSAEGVVCVNLQRQGRNHCLLTVSNPGEPIPPNDLERIFERFYRADAARSRTGSFGLGLPIARVIVQKHNGKIWAISNATGNCFCVQLPCNPEK